MKAELRHHPMGIPVVPPPYVPINPAYMEGERQKRAVVDALELRLHHANVSAAIWEARAVRAERYLMVAGMVIASMVYVIALTLARWV
jgi:hypothetical protein